MIPDADETEKGLQLLKVHIKTDRSIPGAFIGVEFSGEVKVDQVSGANQPMLVGAATQQINWNTPLYRNGVPVPNSYGFIINAPAAFMPGMDLVITAKSKAPVHVLNVGNVSAAP
jgi:hypothetical protein